MLHILISFIGILLTIFFVIGTHESAHFFAARALGVKVLRFSIGFGKTLFKWTDKSGTEYVFALIPLGGYVRMLDEGEGEVPAKEKHLAYNRQPFYKKFLIVLAGPAINIFLALVLYWLIFVIGFMTIKPVIGAIAPNSIAAQSGLPSNQEIIAVDNNTTSNWAGILFRIIAHSGNQDRVAITTQPLTDGTPKTYSINLQHWHLDELNPDPLKSLGITPFEPKIPLVIGMILKDSHAATSALRVGDTIIAINKIKINDWTDVLKLITEHPDQTLMFSVNRNKQTLELPITIGSKRDILFQKTGKLGIGPKFEWPKEYVKTVQYGPIEAISHAWKEMVDLTYFNLLIFGKLITGKVSLQSLGGPITIFETAGESFYTGFFSFISFLAFFSISIGVINLLPIPGLDGGHLFFQIIELIIRRPIPEKVLLLSYRLGFILIFLLLAQSLTNDLLRLYK